MAGIVAEASLWQQGLEAGFLALAKNNVLYVEVRAGVKSQSDIAPYDGAMATVQVGPSSRGVCTVQPLVDLFLDGPQMVRILGFCLRSHATIAPSHVALGGGVASRHRCTLAGLRIPVVPCQDHHIGAAGLHCGRDDERAGRCVPAEGTRLL